MYSFIILGDIPGTHIEITFTMWLTTALLIIGSLLSVRMVRRQVILKLRIVAAFIAMSLHEPRIAQPDGLLSAA